MAPATIGYECEVIWNPPRAQHFQCSICLHVLREPYQATCCGENFCKECILRVEACPTCRGKRRFRLFPDIGLQRVLYDVRVSCTHKSQGCDWTGELRELDSHLNSDSPADKALEGCPYTLVKCPLGCAECKNGIYRKDIKAHAGDLSKYCVKAHAGDDEEGHHAETACTGGDEKGHAETACTGGGEKAHTGGDEKGHAETACTEGGEKAHTGGDEKGHAETACTGGGVKAHTGGDGKGHAETACTGGDEKGPAETACAGGMPKYFIKAHVGNKIVSPRRRRRFELSAGLLRQTMIKLESKVDVRMAASKPQRFMQPQQPVTGTYKPVGARFTMKDFGEYKRDNDTWYSPHFYTHPDGYKMCLHVDANGNASGRGTHLSVFVCLMQGEFDDQLKWPFRGDITIKLVDQKEGRDHVIGIFRSRNAGERCERVMTKERIDNGWGIGQFLSHAELQPKYLKDNCIEFYIKKIDLY